jgi:threonine/homoserine/homoserine lactone efflux protein
MSVIIRGIILGLSITAPIGPTNIEIIRRGTKNGWRAAVMFCLGVIVALVIYLCIVTFGLSFLSSSPLFNRILTSIGILVLAYLAFSSIRDFFSGSAIDLETPQSGAGHFFPGIVLTIANPAVLLLWTGIMGADLSAGGTDGRSGLLLVLGILIGVSLFFTVLTFLVHNGRKYLQSRYYRYVSLAAGLIFIGFCVGFAIDLLADLV